MSMILYATNLKAKSWSLKSNCLLYLPAFARKESILQQTTLLKIQIFQHPTTNLLVLDFHVLNIFWFYRHYSYYQDRPVKEQGHYLYSAKIWIWYHSSHPWKKSFEDILYNHQYHHNKMLQLLILFESCLGHIF